MHKCNELNGDNQAYQCAICNDQRVSTSLAVDCFGKSLAQICKTSYALVAVKNGSNKYYVSTIGISPSQTSLDMSVLEHLLHDAELVELEISNSASQLNSLEFFSKQTALAYFAGFALFGPDSQRIGMVCVAHDKPCLLNQEQKLAIEALTKRFIEQTHSGQLLDLDQLEEAFHFHDICTQRSPSNSGLSLEQLFARALDALKDQISIIDESGCNVFVNKAWTEFAAQNSTKDKLEALGRGSNYIQVCEKSEAAGSEDASFVLASIRAALQDPTFSVRRIEYPCHSPLENRWFVASISSLTVAARKLVVISHHNITRRMQAEIANNALVDQLEVRVRERTLELEEAYATLRISEEKYSSLFKNSTVGFFIASASGDCEDVNSAFCSLVGREREELIGNKIGLVLFDQDAKVIERLQAEVLSGRSANMVRDVRISRPDELHKWGRASVSAIFDSNGKPMQTMNLIQDFTLQKKAKQERDQVFEQSFDLFAIVEYNGVIHQANHACTRMFGVSGRHLPGKSIVDFVHPDDVPKAYSVLATMKNADNELPALNIRMRSRDGSYRDVRWSGTKHTEQPRLIVIGRDVTHSINSKRALQRLASRLQQIREEERTRISREIHDELGQILTALKIDLDLLQRDVGVKADEEISLGIDAITELVNSTLSSVKRIAQDLRPEVLDALGLVPALEWHAKETQNRANLECTVVCQQDVPALNSEQTTQLFRIIQEAMTNVVRHAEATQVRISLEINAEGDLHIEIRDDGNGFDVHDLELQSLGLLGMQERARAIGADLDIKSSLSEGTVITVTLAANTSVWDEQE